MTEKGYVEGPVDRWSDERLESNMARIQQQKMHLQRRLAVLQEVRYGGE